MPSAAWCASAAASRHASSHSRSSAVAGWNSSPALHEPNPRGETRTTRTATQGALLSSPARRHELVPGRRRRSDAGDAAADAREIDATSW